MIRNITLSAEKEIIEKARQRAKADHTTLNAEFRRWLAHYARLPVPAVDLAELIESMSYVQRG